MTCKITIALLLSVSILACADTRFGVPDKIAKANREKVLACAEGAYWAKSPFAVCAVEPMSWIKRTPDLFPEDGDFAGPVKVLATKGEYENGSFMLFAFEDVDSLVLKPTDLTCGAARIPASAIDIKVVKVWYQSGTAWGGYFSDPLRRIATPELLLHDENLIEVDHSTRDNYVRSRDGDKEFLFWVSCDPAACGHAGNREVNIPSRWIHDSSAIKPIRLNRNEFKQVLLTIHVPDNAKAGIYTGAIEATAANATIAVPLTLRVLPFTLPRAGTFRDSSRTFSALLCTRFTEDCPYFGAPATAADITAHNAEICWGYDGAPEPMAKHVKEYGLEKNVLFGGVPNCDITTSYPPKETDRNFAKFHQRLAEATNRLAAMKAAFGDDTQFYSYGIDEALPDTVRAERATWRAMQQLGIKTFASSRYHPYLLFNLDLVDIPVQARQTVNGWKAKAVHDANPDARVGWYSDPHSGPENPDMTRRLYGLQTWRADYDMTMQYILFRENWNDFWIPDEPHLRGLMFVYPQSRGLIDTLQWEGLREGMDDVRYATYLRELCAEGMKSADIDAVYAARAASTWISQVDCERASLDYLRLEIIRRIMILRKLLGKEAE